MPWAKIITIPGSRIMSSLMWVLSQAITTTACFPGILRAVYCSYCLHNFQCKLSKSQVKSYLRFICRVSNVCRPGGHRRSCAFSISSVTVWGVAMYMIKQCQQLRFHEKDPPMWTGHPDSWRDLLIMAWSTASGVEIIPPHLIKKSQLKKVIITCTLWPSPWRELLPNASHHLPQSGPGHNFFLYNGIKYL